MHWTSLNITEPSLTNLNPAEFPTADAFSLVCFQAVYGDLASKVQNCLCQRLFLWLLFLSTALCGGCSRSHANQASTSVVFAPALDTGVTVAVPTTSPLKFTDSNLIFSSQKLWKIELLDRKTFQNNAKKIYCSNVFRAFLQSGSSHLAFFCIFLEVTRRKHLMTSLSSP